MTRAARAAALILALALVPMTVVGDEVPVPRNYGEAMRWYQRAAEAGQPRAQFYYGVILEQGVHGAPDLAADAGSAMARFNLAQMYERGSGVDRVPARAVALYEQAAEGGITAARAALAVMYARGAGVDRDPVRAMMWLRLAQSAGLAVDPALTTALSNGMSETERAEAVELARAWLERAAARAAARGSAEKPPVGEDGDGGRR